MTVLCIVGSILMLVFGIGAFWVTIKADRNLKKMKKEIEAEEKKVNETVTKASNTKADARTGDHERDLNYMADVLHDYANKK